MYAGRVTRVSCAWCHTMNPARQKVCSACEHRADLPRQDCDCPRCVKSRAIAAAIGGTTTEGPVNVQ